MMRASEVAPEAPGGRGRGIQRLEWMRGDTGMLNPAKEGEKRGKKK
jgi:hypothetical protein